MFAKKIMKLAIKKGKKGIAVKSLTKALRKLRPYLPSGFLKIIFNKLAPLVKIYKKKVAGKVYQLPWRSSLNRSRFQAAKWIMLGVKAEKNRKRKDLAIKIGRQLLKTWRNQGLPLKLKEQFVEVIKENRSYMRFIRRKRVKKKVYKFKNRYTKKGLVYKIFGMRRKLKKEGNKLFKLKKKKINVKGNNKKFNTKNKKYRR